MRMWQSLWVKGFFFLAMFLIEHSSLLLSRALPFGERPLMKQNPTSQMKETVAFREMNSREDRKNNNKKNKPISLYIYSTNAQAILTALFFPKSHLHAFSIYAVPRDTL